jgi:hypothetical protein
MKAFTAANYRSSRKQRGMSVEGMSPSLDLSAPAANKAGQQNGADSVTEGEKSSYCCCCWSGDGASSAVDQAAPNGDDSCDQEEVVARSPSPEQVVIEAEDMVAREAGGGGDTIELVEARTINRVREEEVDEDDPSTWHLHDNPNRSSMPCLS